MAVVNIWVRLCRGSSSDQIGERTDGDGVSVDECEGL
jgi:hypothetical protein